MLNSEFPLKDILVGGGGEAGGGVAGSKGRWGEEVLRKSHLEGILIYILQGMCPLGGHPAEPPVGVHRSGFSGA